MYAINSVLPLKCDSATTRAGDFYLALNCPVSGQENLNDTSRGFTAPNALYVNVTVAMYQTFPIKLGKSYAYRQDWLHDVIDSSQFTNILGCEYQKGLSSKNAQTCTNPSPPTGYTLGVNFLTASNVKIGSFKVGKDSVPSIPVDTTSTVKFDQAALVDTTLTKSSDFELYKPSAAGCTYTVPCNGDILIRYLAYSSPTASFLGSISNPGNVISSASNDEVLGVGVTLGPVFLSGPNHVDKGIILFLIYHIASINYL